MEHENKVPYTEAGFKSVGKREVSFGGNKD